MRFRKPLVVIAATTITVGVAGAAFAAWVTSGSGSGYATASSAKALTTVSASPDAALYPGATTGLTVVIKNDNPYPVTVSDVVGGGAITSDKGTACNASTGVTFTDQHGLTLLVPANSAGTSFTLAGAVRMSNASDNSCQGATFTVPVTLSGGSSAS